MENIYKIKIKTNPDPRGLYPSERRYSASIVLGLSVVHISLASTAILMACLTLQTIKTEHNDGNLIGNFTANSSNKSTQNIVYNDDVSPDVSTQILSQNVEEKQQETIYVPSGEVDVTFSMESYSKAKRELPKEQAEVVEYSKLTFAPCILTLGGLAAGLSGLLAWKRWYIDHNIKWFFIMSSISTFTSMIALILITVTILSLYKTLAVASEYNLQKKPNLRLVLAVNILITCLLEFIWSILSTKVGYKGMKNEYPDDIVISKSRGGKIEVNTVHKGNKKGKATPPDILNHFSAPGKFAKYFPKKDDGNLPKAESNSEYQERVRKFLAAEVDNDCSK